MKKLLLFLMIIALFVSCGAKPKSNNDIEMSKADPRLKTAYENAKKNNEMDKKFECLIKFIEPTDEKKLNLLRKAGFEVRTSTKTIITGSVLAKDLSNVLKLNFVKYMELAVPLSPKKK